MFTGIIKAVGRIATIDRYGSDVRMRIDSGALDLQGLPVGASIAVNGACLTAVEIGQHEFAADLSAETLRVTALGELAIDSPVNLEPATRAGDPLDGHLVTGHVDGIGKVTAIAADGRAQQLDIALPEGLDRYVAKKGSVTIDGVSLTVNAVEKHALAVAIIPHTLTATTIQHYEIGTAVNIEVDIIARYLERLMEHG